MEVALVMACRLRDCHVVGAIIFFPHFIFLSLFLLLLLGAAAIVAVVVVEIVHTGQESGGGVLWRLSRLVIMTLRIERMVGVVLLEVEVGPSCLAADGLVGWRNLATVAR